MSEYDDIVGGFEVGVAKSVAGAPVPTVRDYKFRNLTEGGIVPNFNVGELLGIDQEPEKFAKGLREWEKWHERNQAAAATAQREGVQISGGAKGREELRPGNIGSVFHPERVEERRIYEVEEGGEPIKPPFKKAIGSVLETGTKGAKDVVLSGFEALSGEARGAAIGASKAYEDFMADPSVMNAITAPAKILLEGGDEAIAAAADALGTRNVGDPNYLERGRSGRAIINKYGLQPVFPENTIQGQIAEMVFHDPVGSAMLFKSAYNLARTGIQKATMKVWGELADKAKIFPPPDSIGNPSADFIIGRATQRGALFPRAFGELPKVKVEVQKPYPQTAELSVPVAPIESRISILSEPMKNDELLSSIMGKKPGKWIFTEDIRAKLAEFTAAEKVRVSQSVEHFNTAMAAEKVKQAETLKAATMRAAEEIKEKVRAYADSIAKRYLPRIVTAKEKLAAANEIKVASPEAVAARLDSIKKAKAEIDSIYSKRAEEMKGVTKYKEGLVAEQKKAVESIRADVKNATAAAKEKVSGLNEGLSVKFSQRIEVARQELKTAKGMAAESAEAKAARSKAIGEAAGKLKAIYSERAVDAAEIAKSRTEIYGAVTRDAETAKAKIAKIAEETKKKADNFVTEIRQRYEAKISSAKSKLEEARAIQPASPEAAAEKATAINNAKEQVEAIYAEQAVEMKNVAKYKNDLYASYKKQSDVLRLRNAADIQDMRDQFLIIQSKAMKAAEDTIEYLKSEIARRVRDNIWEPTKAQYAEALARRGEKLNAADTTIMPGEGVNANPYVRLPRESNVIKEINAVKTAIAAQEARGADAAARGLLHTFLSRATDQAKAARLAMSEAISRTLRINKRIGEAEQLKEGRNILDQMRGEMAIIQDDAATFQKVMLENIPKAEDREILGKIVTGEIPLNIAEVTYPQLMPYAMKGISTEMQFSESLFQQGLLSAETMDKMYGIHSRRFFLEMMEEAGMKTGAGKGAGISAKEAGGLKARQALSEEQLEALGELKDYGVAGPMSFSLQGSTIAKRAALDKISKLDRLVVQEGAGVPKGWKEIPNDKARYGPLAGKTVHPTVYRDVAGPNGAFSATPNVGAFAAMMKTWKVGMTVMNPATSFRNLLSSLFHFSSLSGAPLWQPQNWRYIWEAIKDYRKGGATWKEMQVKGYLATSYPDVIALRPGMTAMERVLSKAVEDQGKMETFLNWLLETRPVDIGKRLYRAGDDIAKMASYKYLRENYGMTPGQAGERIQMFHQDYANVPSWIRAAEKNQGSNLFWSPFMSFKYEQARIFKNMLTDPIALYEYAKLQAVKHAIRQGMISSGIISEEDLRQYEKNASPSSREFGSVFSPHFGGVNIVGIDPIYQVFDLLGESYALADSIAKGDSKEVKQGGPRVLSLLGAMQSPVAGVLTKFYSGYDNYRKREITQNDAPFNVKVQDTVGSILEDILPPLIPFLGRGAKELQASWNGDAVADKRTAKTVIESALNNILGINYIKTDEVGKRESRRIMDREQRNEVNLLPDLWRESHPDWEPKTGMFQNSYSYRQKYEVYAKLHSAERRGDKERRAQVVSQAVEAGIFKASVNKRTGRILKTPEMNVEEGYEQFLMPQADRFFVKMLESIGTSQAAQVVYWGELEDGPYVKNPKNREALERAMEYVRMKSIR